MAAMRRLERRVERRAGSSPVSGTNSILSLRDTRDGQELHKRIL